jgi:hypothetical protein
MKEVYLDFNKMGNDPEIASLVEFGTRGHFPLFYPQWFYEVFSSQNKCLSKSDEDRAKKILKKLQKHKSLDRKKTLLSSLNKDERDLFIKSFLKIVEGKILDKKPELQ